MFLWRSWRRGSSRFLLLGVTLLLLPSAGGSAEATERATLVRDLAEGESESINWGVSGFAAAGGNVFYSGSLDGIEGLWGSRKKEGSPRFWPSGTIDSHPEVSWRWVTACGSTMGFASGSPTVL